MKVKGTILVMLFSYTALHSVEGVSQAITESTGAHLLVNSYYRSANLERLNAEGRRKHAPLAILIDQHNQENPDSDSIFLTQQFARLLQSAFVPIIVSYSVVYNYFKRRARGEDNFSSANNPVSLDKWEMYIVKETPFALFLPDHYSTYYESDFGFKSKLFDSKMLNIPHTHNMFDRVNLIKDDDLMKKMLQKSLSFSVSDLSKILITNKESQKELAVWDIILHGHGSYGGDIGGMPPKDMQKLLTFFNDELDVGIFDIETCSAGGENLNLLEFDETIGNKVMRTLNYIVLVGGVSDKSTWFYYETSNELFNKLYSNAARLQGKGGSLNELLNDLNDFYRSSGSLHGSTNIPQVWLPGGLGFQTFQINEQVQVLGNVRVLAHQDERRSITLPDSTRAVLVYLKNIGVPIEVGPTIVSDPGQSAVDLAQNFLKTEFKQRKKEWRSAPSVAELMDEIKAFNIFKVIDRSPYNYPGLQQLLISIANKKLQEDSYYTIAIELAKAISGASALLYPEFISMMRGNETIQHLHKIELLSAKDNIHELTGVMHFIRDSFFDIAERKTTKIFLVDELVGYNDLLPLLELSRVKNDVKEQHPLEIALKNDVGKEITLHKIRIKTDAKEAQLSFIFGDAAWELRFNPSDQNKSLRYWNFKQQQANAYTIGYDWVKKETGTEDINQKAISDVLGKSQTISRVSEKQE